MVLPPGLKGLWWAGGKEAGVHDGGIPFRNLAVMN
jgi:hypothetical protein